MGSPLIGTVDGVFDLDGNCLLAESIGHLARSETGWWAVGGDAGVWQGPRQVASAPPGVRLNCILPGPDGVWLGADSARLYRLQGDRVTEDEFFTDAPGRASWHTPWGGPPDVRSMAFGRDGVLYVNVHVGGIVRYDNTGLAATVDIDSDVHQVIAHPDRKALVLAATAWGLAVSTNGHDFDFRTDGLDHRYCRAVAVHGSTVLVSASRGPGGRDAGLYRGDVAEGPLQRCSTGLPGVFAGNIDTHCLLAGPEGAYVATGATVWISHDEGRSWEVARDGFPEVTCLA